MSVNECERSKLDDLRDEDASGLRCDLVEVHLVVPSSNSMFYICFPLVMKIHNWLPHYFPILTSQTRKNEKWVSL